MIKKHQSCLVKFSVIYTESGKSVPTILRPYPWGTKALIKVLGAVLLPQAISSTQGRVVVETALDSSPAL